MNTIKPILQVVMACFLWGGLFAVPLYLADYYPVDIVLGRFFFFGITSVFLLLFYAFYSGKTHFFKYWKEAALCAFVMNILHYTALVLGMRFVSASLVTVILGTSPITITVVSCLIKNQKDLLATLFLPSLCIFAGIVIMNLELMGEGMESLSPWDYVIGFTFGLVALATWTWYVIYNSEFMKQNKDINPNEWTALVGVLTLMFTLVAIIARYYLLEPGHFYQFHWEHESGRHFLFCTLILGIFCSWIAFALWNASSSRINPALSGQLTILETIFGLGFVYSLQGQLPTFLEALGILFILAGVSGGVYRSMQEEGFHHA